MSEFTDMDLQWFRGGPTVVEVVNVITETDIVGDEDERVCGCGCQGTEVHDECTCGKQSCFWCCDTLVYTSPTDADIPF